MGDQVTGIEVRYFAAAVDAAGREKETVELAPPADLGALKAALIERHGPGMERVLTVAAFLVGAGPDAELTRDLTRPAGDRVDVLPPFAGG
ncbi:MoaD/ThiS family protein [Rhodococcus zopfii]|uniref:MoaD/ThiS family protein n=1 Tax=Rhodococcus zopfii TaxID=43772 RepID=UPI00093304DB|nr:MoaD/ThiS family protein [Rhodococcus zopfii]